MPALARQIAFASGRRAQRQPSVSFISRDVIPRNGFVNLMWTRRSTSSRRGEPDSSGLCLVGTAKQLG